MLGVEMTFKAVIGADMNHAAAIFLRSRLARRLPRGAVWSQSRSHLIADQLHYQTYQRPAVSSGSVPHSGLLAHG
jgi:hypothetical protein